MIFIDPAQLEDRVSGEWRAEAARITRELESAAADDRAALIKQHEDQWRELKRELGRASRGKCWYCESAEYRSDNAVDHFRPKGRLAENKDHGGYWWLAFVVANYRFSCTFCNSRRKDVERGTAGGKQDHFPLRDERARAWEPTDDLAREEPLLLDPCRVGDVALLWFDDAGETKAHPAFEADAEAGARVECSRQIYHLDHGDIVRARRRVYRDVRRLVERVDSAFAAMRSDEPAARELFEDLLKQLHQRTRSESEYAAVARCALRGFTVSSGAVQALVEAF